MSQIRSKKTKSILVILGGILILSLIFAFIIEANGLIAYIHQKWQIFTSH